MYVGCKRTLVHDAFLSLLFISQLVGYNIFMAMFFLGYGHLEL
jgi:hypothetical protein